MMSIESATVTVTTTPSALAGHGWFDSREGQALSVYNPGPATVYLGGNSVTVAGWPLAAGEKEAFDLATDNEIIYAVTASGTQALNVLRLGS